MKQWLSVAARQPTPIRQSTARILAAVSLLLSALVPLAVNAQSAASSSSSSSGAAGAFAQASGNGTAFAAAQSANGKPIAAFAQANGDETVTAAIQSVNGQTTAGYAYTPGKRGSITFLRLPDKMSAAVNLNQITIGSPQAGLIVIQQGKAFRLIFHHEQALHFLVTRLNYLILP